MLQARGLCNAMKATGARQRDGLWLSIHNDQLFTEGRVGSGNVGASAREVAAPAVVGLVAAVLGRASRATGGHEHGG